MTAAFGVDVSASLSCVGASPRQPARQEKRSSRSSQCSLGTSQWLGGFWLVWRERAAEGFPPSSWVYPHLSYYSQAIWFGALLSNSFQPHTNCTKGKAAELKGLDCCGLCAVDCKRCTNSGIYGAANQRSIRLTLAALRLRISSSSETLVLSIAPVSSVLSSLSIFTISQPTSTSAHILAEFQ